MLEDGGRWTPEAGAGEVMLSRSPWKERSPADILTWPGKTYFGLLTRLEGNTFFFFFKLVEVLRKFVIIVTAATEREHTLPGPVPSLILGCCCK